MQTNTALSLSPSFSIYSNSRIAEIAARTVDEFDSDEFPDEIYSEDREDPMARRGGESDDDFEFSVAAMNFEFSSQNSADEIFQNGKIRPVYSVFNRDFWVKFQNEVEKENSVRDDAVSPKIRLPLRKLFLDERETTLTTSSSSSSEADELDGVAAVNYCVWPPKVGAVEEEEGRCKKISSAGCNSKRWKLRDFLRRSNSDGSETKFAASKENEMKFTDDPSDGGKVEAAAPLPSPNHLNGGEKERSNLTYRHDLVGLFGDVNALRKKLESF